MADWEAIERSEEFRELVRRRRSFVVPATIFFLAYYMGFILLAGYAPDFMGESVYEGLTVGYCLRADPVPDGLRARHLVPAQGRPASSTRWPTRSSRRPPSSTATTSRFVRKDETEVTR